MSFSSRIVSLCCYTLLLVLVYLVVVRLQSAARKPAPYKNMRCEAASTEPQCCCSRRGAVSVSYAFLQCVCVGLRGARCRGTCAIGWVLKEASHCAGLMVALHGVAVCAHVRCHVSRWRGSMWSCGCALSGCCGCVGCPDLRVALVWAVFLPRMSLQYRDAPSSAPPRRSPGCASTPTIYQECACTAAATAGGGDEAAVLAEIKGSLSGAEHFRVISVMGNGAFGYVFKVRCDSS